MAKGSDFRIVRLGPRSWAEVASLQRRCFPSPWDENTVREVMASPLCRGLGVEEPAFGHMVAYALNAVQGDLCHLLDLCVLPEWRRRGLGAGLIAAVTADARGLGASRVFLEVRESNAVAQALYCRLGFVLKGRRPRYYPDTGEDALVLARDLGAEPGP